MALVVLPIAAMLSSPASPWPAATRPQAARKAAARRIHDALAAQAGGRVQRPHHLHQPPAAVGRRQRRRRLGAAERRQRPRSGSATTAASGWSCSPTSATPRSSATARRCAVYDASRNTVYVLAAEAALRRTPRTPVRTRFPAIAPIKTAISRLASQANLSGADARRHRRPAGLLGARLTRPRRRPAGRLQLAWDAQHGVPLKVAVYSRGDSSPVLALTATEVHYGAIPSSDLSVQAPASAQVSKVHAAHPGRRPRSGHQPDVSGTAAVARHLPFPLAAPRSLVGLPRQTVRLVEVEGQTAAVVVYGKGLGAVRGHPAGCPAGVGRAIRWPRCRAISINGATRPRAGDGARHRAARSSAAASPTR